MMPGWDNAGIIHQKYQNHQSASRFSTHLTAGFIPSSYLSLSYVSYDSFRTSLAGSKGFGKQISLKDSSCYTKKNIFTYRQQKRAWQQESHCLFENVQESSISFLQTQHFLFLGLSGWWPSFLGLYCTFFVCLRLFILNLQIIRSEIERVNIKFLLKT